MKKPTITILILALLVLIFLIAADKPPQPIVSSGPTPSDRTSLVSGTPRPPQKRVQISKEQAYELSQAIPEPEEGNLTQSVAYSIVQGILNQGSEQGVAPSEGELLTQILSAPVNLSVEDFVPEIRKGDLLSISDPSRTDYEVYYEGLANVVEKYFVTIDINVNQFSSQTFSSAAKDFDEMLESLYGLSAPGELVDFHEEQIRLIAIQKQVFENLTNFDDDPLKAIGSIQVFEEAANQTEALWASLIESSDNSS